MTLTKKDILEVSYYGNGRREDFIAVKCSCIADELEQINNKVTECKMSWTKQVSELNKIIKTLRGE